MRNGKRIHLPPGSRNLPKGLRYDPRRREYLIDIWAEGKRIREYVGPNRRSAEAILAKKRSEIAEGKHLEKRPRRTSRPLPAWAKEYLELKERAGRRDLKLRSYYIRLFCERFPARSLDRIESEDVERWRDELAANGNKPATVRNALGYTGNFFEEALRRGIIEKNPCRLVEKPKRPKGRTRFLTPEEAVRLLVACPMWLADVIGLALETGFRREEVLTLRRSDLRFDLGENGMIFLREEETKAKKPRYIPMTSRAREIFEGIPPNISHPFVFSCPSGKPLNKDVLRYHFEKACKVAGIEDFHFHDLRHTVGSWLVQRGVPLYIVSQILGHSSLETTQRYAHLAPDHLAAGLAALGNYKQTGSKTGTNEKGAFTENRALSLSY